MVKSGPSETTNLGKTNPGKTNSAKRANKHPSKFKGKKHSHGPM